MQRKANTEEFDPSQLGAKFSDDYFSDTNLL